MDLREGRSKPCVYLEEGEEWGGGGSERTDREAACAVAAGGWPGCSGDKAPL